MAKDVLITPASSLMEFKDTGVTEASVYEASGNLHLDAAGDIVLGDGTPADVELGGVGVPVQLSFVGGGSVAASGNSLDIGAPGDVINLNVAGVTYNFPSTLITTSDYTAADILAKLKTVDGAGSGLEADAHYHYDSAPRIQASSYTSAGAGWYRIAKTSGGLNHGMAIISLFGNTSGNHAAAKFVVSNHHGQSAITQIGGFTYSGAEFSQVRTMYLTSDRIYGGCAFEVYFTAALAIHFTIEDINLTSKYNEWSINAGATDALWSQDKLLQNVTTYALQSTNAPYALSSHAHTTFDNSTALTGANVYSNIAITDGIVTALTSRALTAADVGASATGHTHAFADLTSKPTTLSGYGITDAAASTHNHDGTYATAAHNHTLDSLSNTTITSNSAGEILKWSGTAWINNTLAEAGIAAASHNQAWSTITSTPTTLSGYGITDAASSAHNHDSAYSASTHNHTLDSLSNTTITSNSAGEILKWNGSAWINNTLAEAGIAASAHNHDGTYATSGHTHSALSAGNGLTGSNYNGSGAITFAVASHAGTAGSVGTLTITADAVGVTLGTTSTTAYRGDYGNTAYTHSQAAHAPSTAQKNSDITKAEIEAVLTGTVSSHIHTGLAPEAHATTHAMDGVDPLTDYRILIPYAVATNTGNAYSISTPAISAYVTGMAVSVKIPADSTGTSTLNWSGLGAKTIKESNGLEDFTKLKELGVYTMRYDGVNFIVQGDGGGIDAAPIAHVGATGTAHGVATTSANGFMSGTDKTKLDGIDAGANKITLGITQPTVGWWFKEI